MFPVKRLTAIGVGMACVAALTVSVSSLAAQASTTTNVTVRPSSTVFDSNNTSSVPGDAAPGFASGSMASNGVGKTDMYFTPEALFGHSVQLGDIASMSYWTKTGATHTADPRDWFLNIYTKPYSGNVSTSGWYGDRIGTEPYFSNNLSDPANTWNQWSTNGGTNTLRFFESTQGAPGATFGSYTDPGWATLISGNALSGDPYSGHDILYFSPQTGSAWAAGFTGQIDGVQIVLNNGDTANINFEADVPCTTVCYVDAVNGNDSFGGDTPVTAKKTIQAAINQVNAGGDVRVLPGTYNESAPGSTLQSGGTYQFGLFFPAAKPGVTVEGVTSGDVPITNPNATQATINTNATNGFGPSGIFVEAADTTIQGVEIGPNASGDNKTIEVIGNNFTLKYSNTSVPGGGSVYINDFSAAGDIVKSYHVMGNVFDDGTSIDISSGAGSTGPVAGRQITGNFFDLSGNTWNAISFNGSGTGVPWFVNTVGGAVITGNSFTGGALQYIRARGTYDNTQFDWQSYWNDNTYNKAAVALVTQSPFDVRAWSYTSGTYTFNNVRRIGATIQGEVDNASAGDTVLVKAGTYREDVVANKSNLKLIGAGIDQSTILGTKGDATLDTLQIPASAPGVSVDGFTVTREGNSTTNWNDPTLNNQGVAIYGNGSTLQNSKITGNRNGVFLYGAQNVNIKNNTITNNRTGVHLVNNVTGLSVLNNFITNNWTMGVLYRDEGSPNTTGAVTVRDNNISGNWYSQIEARSLFSAPSLDMTRNWLGTTSPTVFVGPAVVGASGSGEPGYSVQIPVAFGGSSVPPASSPTIVYNGLNATNPVNYIPFQCSGADTSAAIGFQPSGQLSSALGECSFAFRGFFQPIDNNHLNVAKAGQTIPVKWQLLFGGVGVSDPSSFVGVTSRKINCTTLGDIGSDAIETYSTNSGLVYQGSGNWQFNWQTPKSYAGTCRTMTVTLSDGTTHEADFQFK